MGSPLSPIIADLVMRDLEEWVLNSVKHQPSFYYRYVDDIILATTREASTSYLDAFNNYHVRLNFTIEYENNRQLNFLDLLLMVQDNTLTIDWYHKKTLSGRYLSFFSNHPYNQKVGTIYGLTDRAILLSHPKFQKNIKLFIDILVDNGYPLSLIFKVINKRIRILKKRLESKTITDKTDINTNRNNNFIVVPFVSSCHRTIKSLLDKSEFNIGYRCLNRLSRFISARKDPTEIFDTNDVVYQISCGNCDAICGPNKEEIKNEN